jgi:trans-2,3-dihydro-3-hydroxyanthranilate isomerase
MPGRILIGNEGERVTANTELLPGEVDWLGESNEHRYLVLDVFTSQPLQGNQLGVFLDGRPFSDEDMQRLAREMNFSETVFVLPPRSDGTVAVRIFTPEEELPFAGHPMLGTAFAVGTALEVDRVVLETGLGPVPITLEREGGRVVFGRMRQPIPTREPFDRADELLAGLGVASSELPVELYRNGPAHVYVALPDEQTVAGLRPDMVRLEDLEICVNCFAGSGRRWKTRMFAPGVAVPEDPATGSAAGPLAIHLATHGRIGFGEEIEIRQGEEINRPSLLYAKVTGSAERIESVEVGGAAQIVASGSFGLTT